MGGCGVGVRRQKYKKPKMADFCHFCSCKGNVGVGPPTRGGPNAPSPHVTTAFFFPEKHQTLHDLSIANCMHGNEMMLIHSV